MTDPETLERMRLDWNRRAREDAHYYAAFGRRGQDDEEFFATACEIVRSLERELKRFPPDTNRGAMRALEIGCGPGRLMRPLSASFGEIHGVDVSDEMIRLACEKLRGIPHAYAHHAGRSDLAAFGDGSFDFVYSYAVFQHIPSHEVVFNYLLESRRVLKPGGLLRCQINGLPETAARYDTWSGVRIQAADIAAFARHHDFQLLALEGARTQYMWTTWRKQPSGWAAQLPRLKGSARARIRRITNAHSSEPLAPTRGRFASVSLWVEDLPPDCDLNHLEVPIGGLPGFASYIGPPELDGLQQLNVYLPEGLGSGLQPVHLLWLGEELAQPATLRLIPPGPLVPRVLNVTDGINLLSGARIVSGTVKVVLEEAERPEDFQAAVNGQTVAGIDIFCTDPRLPRHEINFRLPARLPPGSYALEMRLGRRPFPPVTIQVAG